MHTLSQEASTLLPSYQSLPSCQRSDKDGRLPTIPVYHSQLTIRVSATKGYLPTPEGRFLGIFPICIFSLRVDRVLFRAGNIVCTTWSHGFTSHLKECELEVFSSFAPKETTEREQDRTFDYSRKGQEH